MDETRQKITELFAKTEAAIPDGMKPDLPRGEYTSGASEKMMCFENRDYENLDFSTNAIESGQYENCRFLNCDFSNSDISGIEFTECEFNTCNLSMMKINGTAFNNVKFRSTKMLGLQFYNCRTRLLSVSFSDCTLDYSSFFGLVLRKAVFERTRLHDVDFTGSDFSKSVFRDCDFANAVFANTNVEGSDFKTSHNYVIDPETNRVRKAKFGLLGAMGLLSKYDIEIS